SQKILIMLELGGQGFPLPWLTLLCVGSRRHQNCEKAAGKPAQLCPPESSRIGSEIPADVGRQHATPIYRASAQGALVSRCTIKIYRTGARPLLGRMWRDPGWVRPADAALASSLSE